MSKELEINGYQIFENQDEAVYLAKSKEDVYNYFVENYGSTEDCQNETKEQFIKNLIEIELDSDFTKRDRDWLNDDTGEITRGSYLDAYRESALKDNGTDVIAYLTW